MHSAEHSSDNEPLISVIIPVYNRLEFIEGTLGSVLSQSYSNWEVIVVDDGSTDGTRDLVRMVAARQPKIRFFERDRDPKGAPVCRNIGIEKSRGEYIVFLDSDDLLAPFCLQQRVDMIRRHGDLDFLVFKTQLFESRVGDLDVLWNIDTEQDDLLRFLSYDAIWQTSGPIYKKAALLRIGGFRDDLPFWQDYHLHLRCLLSGMTYKKCFELPADNFHRKNKKDGISRVTPFVDEPSVLQKRFDIYLSVVESARATDTRIGKEHTNAMESVLFYFASAWLLNHGSLNKFASQWSRASKATNMSLLRHYGNLTYGVLRFLSKKNLLFGKMLRAFEYVVDGILVDARILSKSRMGKVKLTSS